MGQSSARELTAESVMNPEVVHVAAGDRLQDAMRLMIESHVTGLPVLNESGKCVGVITASNLLAYEREYAEESEAGVVKHFNPDTRRWESVRASAFGLEGFGEVLVEEVMERDVIYAHLSTPLREVAQAMQDAQIHRVFVRDGDDRLCGVVSSFDFVRIFAETN